MKLRKAINIRNKNESLESVILTIDKFKQYESECLKQRFKYKNQLHRWVWYLL
jgi:hypothetical protein